MPSDRIDLLFADPDPAILKTLEAMAKKNALSFFSATTGSVALEAFDRAVFRAAFVDLELPGLSGLQVLEWVRGFSFPPEIMIMANVAPLEMVTKTLKLGAFDFFTKPFLSPEKIEHGLKAALEKYDLICRLHHFEQLGASDCDFETLVGRGAKMLPIFELIRQMAACESNVLIQGESGTGKELIAKAIHYRGLRHERPFVVINCSAMPDTLLESELFGYVRGAFTGASSDKQGLFEAADGGTVFLDEIAEVAFSMQVKLLRVLQEGEIRKIGDTGSRKVDVRILAATNKDLASLVRQGKFREDLFYRLNVIHIQVPPLRERSEDILLLAHHFLKNISKKMDRPIDKISVDALEALQNYNWPGNVRELENVMERAIVLCEGNVITARSLPARVLSQSFYNISSSEKDFSHFSYKEAKKRALNLFNRSYMIALLEKTAGNISAAADKAGMDRSNFKKIIRKFDISLTLK